MGSVESSGVSLKVSEELLEQAHVVMRQTLQEVEMGLHARWSWARLDSQALHQGLVGTVWGGPYPIVRVLRGFVDVVDFHQPHELTHDPHRGRQFGCIWPISTR